VSPARSSLVVTMSLVQTARLLASCGQTAAFAVLVNRLDDPVDSGVATDGLVLGVNEDDLKVLVSSILVDPVRVQHSQVGTSSSNTLLGSGAERPLVLELVDTLVGRLSVGGTLRDGLLSVSTADTDTVDNVALLGLVSETTSLVGA